MMGKTGTMLAGLGLASLMLGASGAALGATINQEFRFDEGSHIVVENLVGRVKVGPTDGTRAYLTASVIGESEQLAKLVRFELTGQGDRQRLEVLYPENHHNLYYESDAGRTHSNVRYHGERYQISSVRRSGAEALQVDLELFLPKGSHVDNLKNLIGTVELADVDADIRVDVAAGAISAADGHGELKLDTGSGAVSVSNHDGRVMADTGSGSVRIVTVLGPVDADTGSGTVEVSGVSGNVSVDTGSGSVRISQIIGDDISADTGSGSVKANDIRGSFAADTGSGSVRLEGIADADAINIDTGSGSVRVRGDLSGVKRLNLDTGSGDVDVTSVKVLNMALRIKVNSGDINVDFPAMNTLRSAKNRLQVSLGDGSGKGVISTGSGDVTVRLDTGNK